MDDARLIAGRIVRDIAAADDRFLDRPEFGASTTMGFLAEHMRRLSELGPPPGLDPAHYMALLDTLEQFYEQASGRLPDQLIGAAATYTVCRQHTEELLGLLNPVLGTSHRLPVWSFI